MWRKIKRILERSRPSDADRSACFALLGLFVVIVALAWLQGR